MGKPFFEMPSNIEEIVSLLNTSNAWHLSMLREGSRIYLYDGDQPIFLADTEMEAECFLAGCFLMTFEGDSLDAITSRVRSGG
jgi:hypothetical protein